MAHSALTALTTLLSLAACALAAHVDGGSSPAAAAAVAAAARAATPGGGRRLLAVKDGRAAAAAVHSGMSLQDAAVARLCVMQCLQHACISWHKIYMGSGDGGLRPADVPAAAAECTLRCGLPEVEAGCLAQTFQRLLNTSPLQYSCGSSCITGLLYSSCSQCGNSLGAASCDAMQLGGSLDAADCLVDAAV